MLTQASSTFRDERLTSRIDPNALARVPRTLAFRYDILPLELDGETLFVGMADPDNAEALTQLRVVTRLRIDAMAVSREEIRERLRLAYAPDVSVRTTGERSDEAPAVRTVTRLLERAVTEHASDVHVEPVESGGRVRFRIDGILREVETIPDSLFALVVSRIKLLAGMDITDKRQPHDGRYTIDLNHRHVDARVSSIPTIAGEKVVIRLLDLHTRASTLMSLGMAGATLESYLRVLRAPYGFIVVTGPTGSGKTTTLYASLAEVNSSTKNICSVEDPIELKLPGIAQVQVNARAGVTFPVALRAFVRQDPSILMIGEMRDAETASVGVSAALTGQLVLTTLHSNDAPRTIERLVGLGIDRHAIASALSVVLAQRLARRLCEECRRPAARGFAAVGCRVCAGTGYTGRIGIFEILVVTDAMRDAIATGASSVHLRSLGKNSGYRPMFEEGLERVAQGHTTLDELRRIVAWDEA